MNGRAVGFDFDHTLGLDNKIERTVALEMLAAWAERRGIVYDSEQAFASIEEAIRGYRAGEQPLDAALTQSFAGVLGDDPELNLVAVRFRDEAVRRAPDFVRILPGVRELLAELSGLQVPYAILTNGWSPLQEEKARLIGFERAVLVSERIGVRKPEAAAFEALAAHLACPLDDLWYVGDDPLTDCSGARRAGATAIWFDWEGHSYPEGLLPPHHVIHVLRQLPELLQGRSSGAANRYG